MADLIDRQAAIDAVIRHLQLDYEYAWGVREAINALSSAQPLTARAISDEDGNLKCSNCGSSECWGNYCMNCGAKMGGDA